MVCFPIFLSRFCLMFASAYTNSAMYFPVATMILVLVALLFVVVQPFQYNTSHFTTINAFFVLLLALLHSCCIVVAVSESEWQPLVPLFLAMTITVVVLPLLYISAIILHSMDVQTADIWGRCDSQDTCLEEWL